ncbi:MAG TPA: hypothetical protein VII61_21120 [Ktedonobacteraceae bacterium]
MFDFIWKIRYTSGTSYEGYEASPLTTPAVWQSITYGLIETFVRWQLQQGYAIGSINIWLATIKKYCALATKAGSKASQHTMGDMPGPPCRSWRNRPQNAARCWGDGRALQCLRVMPLHRRSPIKASYQESRRNGTHTTGV